MRTGWVHKSTQSTPSPTYIHSVRNFAKISLLWAKVILLCPNGTPELDRLHVSYPSVTRKKVLSLPKRSGDQRTNSLIRGTDQIARWPGKPSLTSMAKRFIFSWHGETRYVWWDADFIYHPDQIQLNLPRRNRPKFLMRHGKIQRIGFGNQKKKGGDGKGGIPGKIEKEVLFFFHFRQGKQTNP